MCLTETKLTDADKFKIRHYTTYRRDRLTGRTPSGGVAILIKTSLDHSRPPDNNNTVIENISVKLTDNTVITSCYNKPLNIFSFADIDALFASSKVLVLGDLNAKHTSWNCAVGNANGTTLYQYALNNNAVILNTDTPTHYPMNGMSPTYIDIAVYKNVRQISEPVSLTELSSDHNPIALTLRSNTTYRYKTITSYKHTDWQQFRKTIDTALKIDNTLTTPDQLEHAVDRFTQILTRAKAKHTKTITLNTDRDEIPDTTKQLIRDRNRVRRLWQRTGMTHLKQDMNRRTHHIRALLAEHRNTQWREKLSAIVPGDNTLWTVSRLLKKPMAPMPNLEINHSTLTTDAEKAEAIADVFESVHTISTQNNHKQTEIAARARRAITTPHTPTKRHLMELLTTPAEVAKYISLLPNRKAPGADEIHNKILKNLSRKAVAQLVYIINAIFKTQHFPTSWKSATVVPIHKTKKDPKLPTSYRPISLLSTISKLTEKIILDRIHKHDTKHKITKDFQFGFRANHSTVQQASRVVTDIITNYNKEKVTTMTLLDVEKAFDTVWIEGLIAKLDMYGFPPILIQLINSYLTDRTFRVRVNGRLSTPRPIRAGIAQGSCLGPKLFTLYINDIPTFPQTNLALYADDTAIYASSFSAEVANKQIQIHVNILERYWELWKIAINPTKTEHITFARKRTNTKIHTPLKINQNKIKTQPVIKYLGVHLDRTLTYNQHVQHTIRKAYSVLKQIYPLLYRRSALSQDTKKLLYTATLRPILTYAAPIWCNASPRALLPLQRFQNKCLRLITGMDRYTRITELHEATNIASITDCIMQLTKKFYSTKTNKNPLIKDIDTAHLRQRRNTHKLPYETPRYHNVEFLGQRSTPAQRAHNITQHN